MNDSLKHYGVQGMRWGVRRYENKDGTLTSAGKKRYGSDRKTKVSKETKDARRDYWLKQDQKAGKDKAPVSRTEQVTDKARKAAESARDIARVGSKYSKSKSYPELSKMSNKEIQDVINRMNLERQYASLKEGDVRSGWEKAGDILEVAGNLMSIATAAAGVYVIFKNRP